MTEVSQDSLPTLKSKFLQVERDRLRGTLSTIDAVRMLENLLNDAVECGQWINDKEARATLQRFATRIGEQMQRLGHTRPMTLISDFQNSDVGCRGLVIVLANTNHVVQVLDELRRAIGVTFDVADLSLAAEVASFGEYDFVAAILDGTHDADATDAIGRVWESVMASGTIRIMCIADSRAGLSEVLSFASSRDIVPFSDEQSLRSALQIFLIPLVTDVTRNVVTHEIGSIPTPPEPYVAHPYGFVGVPIGRNEEFNTLNSYFLRQSAAVVVLLAIGGAGKTSVAWEWFRRLSRSATHGYDGIVWWSFYEAGASYERFLTHAVAYLLQRPLDNVAGLSRRERERCLFEYCERKRVLVVLDGLERELVGYSEGYHLGMFGDHTQSDPLNNVERRCSNPWFSQFLHAAATTGRIALLLTSRVFPLELDGIAHTIELSGLSSRDGEILWRSVQPGQESGVLHSAVDALGGHPLAIKALAAAVSADPHAGGNLEKWLALNGYRFTDVYARVSQRATHVLKYAMQRLEKPERLLLEYASCCHSRIAIPMVKECLAIDEAAVSNSQVDASLDTLQCRGLLGVTGSTSESTIYLHPLVAGAVRDGMPRPKVVQAMEVLRQMFRQKTSVRAPSFDSEVSDDLLNLLHTDIQLRDYCDATTLLKSGLADQLLHRCSDQRRTTDVLFPMLATDVTEVVAQYADTAYLFNVLGISSRFLGDVTRSERAFDAMIRICEIGGHNDGLRAAYYNGSSTARASGRLARMFNRLQSAIELSVTEGSFESRFDLAKSITFLGRAYGIIDRLDDSVEALGVARAMFSELSMQEGRPSAYCFNESAKHFVGVVNAYEAESQYQRGDAIRVRELAKMAVVSAQENKYVVDFIRGSRLLAAADTLESRWGDAIEKIAPALEEAREHDRMEEELALHVLLTRALVGAGQCDRALAAISVPLSFPFLDSMNVQACEVYLAAAEAYADVGDADAAANHAKRAFEESRCDGAPFCISRVHQAAQKLIQATGAGPPGGFAVSTTSRVPSFFEISKAYNLRGGQQ
jgi:tetratricopeptide (TPR) repeat protein